jgi:hypothetical protein
MRTWDTKAIFEAAGGATALRQALLASTGEAPDITAMYMWTQRDRIAADWLPECLWAAIKAKAYLTVWDLMCERKPPQSDEDRAPTISPFPPYTGEMDLEC